MEGRVWKGEWIDEFIEGEVVVLGEALEREREMKDGIKDWEEGRWDG